MNKWILLGVATLMVSPAWGQHQNIRKGGGSGGTATATNALNSLNGISGAAQPTQGFAVGTSGSDFNISSAGATHTFNLPDAASGTRGLLTGSDWLTFNTKAPTNAPTLHTPVLLGPVIADFTSSQHGHLNVSSGGTLNASAIGSGVFPSARYGTNIITDQSLITPAPADRLLIVDDSGAVLGSILWSDIEAIAGEGSGDVVKDGTVADQQIGLWTGDGTLGSSATFVYNGTNVLLSGAGATNAFGSNYVRTASNDTLFLGANGQNLWEFLTTGTITPGTAGAQGIGSTAKPIGSLKTLSAVVGALQATNLTALESIDATTESTLEAALDLDDLQGTLSGNKVGTGIAADNITTDTLSDARLSSAVALTNVANTFHNPLRLIGGTSVTTSSAGQFDFDTDGYGAGRGAYQYNDGTDNAFLVMVDPLDSPSAGDRLTFRSGDLPDWQPDSISIAGTPGAATQLTLWQDANTLRFVTGLNYNTNINFLSIPASGGMGFNSLANLSDSSGTTTLMRIDAIDATTESTLEAALDLDDLQGTLSGSKVGTGIAADNITTDTLSDARLSSAVALTNVANTFHNPLRLIGGTSVTTSSAGQFDFDTDAYGAGRGAYQYFDGTDNTLLVMVDPLDSPSEGDRLTFRSGDLPDWQPDSINIAGTPGAATQLTLWQDANTLRFVTGLNYNTNINFLSIPASGGIGFNSLANLSDSSGTTTLMRIDAIDATTKATLESAIGPIVTNLAYASSQTLSGHISTQAFQTNSLTGNTSILLTNGVAGKSFKMSFLSDGSARTISFFSDLPMTWMSTNGTVNATNFQSVASKRGTFYGEYINVSPTQVGIEMWGINAP